MVQKSIRRDSRRVATKITLKTRAASHKATKGCEMSNVWSHCARRLPQLKSVFFFFRVLEEEFGRLVITNNEDITWSVEVILSSLSIRVCELFGVFMEVSYYFYAPEGL